MGFSAAQALFYATTVLGHFNIFSQGCSDRFRP